MGFAEILRVWLTPRTGSAFVFAWVNSAFFTTALTGSEGAQNDALMQLWNTSCIGVLAGLLLLLAVRRWLGQLALNPRMQYAACLVQALGTLLMAQGWTEVLGPGATMLLAVVGALLSGVSSAVLLVAWGEVYGRIETAEAEVSIVASVLLSLVITVVFFGLSGWAAPLVLALMPVASCVALRRAYASSSCGSMAEDDPCISNGVEGLQSAPDGSSAVTSTGGCGESPVGAAIPGEAPMVQLDGEGGASAGEGFGWRSGVFVAVAWVVLTFTKFCVGMPLREDGTFAFLGSFAASTLVAFLVAPLYLSRARKVSLLTMSRLVLPALCFGLLLLTVYPHGAPEAAFVVTSTTAILFDMALWMASASLIRQRKGTATRVVGKVRGSVQAGAVLAIGCEALVPQAGLSATSAVCMFAIVCAFVLALPELRQEPDAPQPTRTLVEDQIRARCLEVAARFGLSARETEVMQLLVKGRDLPYIHDELCISRNTVRTHMRHIYEKMDIHSKQELIDLVLF